MELFLNTYGSYLSKKDNMFEVLVEGKKTKLSPERISSIIITNAISITSDAIQLAMEFNIDVVFLDKYGTPYGRIWFPKLGSTTAIRRRQLELLSEELGIEFIKERILLKIMNQYRFLKTLLSKREKVKFLYTSELERMHINAVAILNAKGTLDELSNSLMGWEGNASKEYFKVLSDLIPDEFRFCGRSARPAKDAFNAFLNYGYGILYSKVERALIIAGLDPYIGLLHADNYNKKSFVFDFIEPYRTIIDEFVFYLFSRQKVQPLFIESINKGVALTTNGKKFFATLLLEHFDCIIRYFNKNRKLIEQIQCDAHAFANFLIGKRADYLESSLTIKLDNFLSQKTFIMDSHELKE